MKKIFIFLSFSFCLLLLGTKTFAASEQIIFWYPGEAGSQTEAQPLLDAFTKLISQQATKQLEAVYSNTEEAGAKYIASQKPLFGILSYPAWLKWQQTHPTSTVFLQVIPSHGKLAEQYLLVGKSTPNAELNISSSEPLSTSFVTEQLFPGKNWRVTITPQAQLLFKLKALSEGKWDGFCLLTPREARSFQALKSPWKENLKFMQASKAIPTARLVLLKNSSATELEIWRKAFLSVAAQAGAQEVLQELDLAGFTK